jgi:hypothetical protein
MGSSFFTDLGEEREIRIDDSEIKQLVYSFLMEIVILNHKWIGKEVPALHRIFPCDLIYLFKCWYAKKNDLNINGDITIVMSRKKFLKYFERRMTKARIKWIRVLSRTQYNLDQGKYKYKFSNLRLTKKGLEFYLPIISDDVNIINWKED